MKSTVEKKPEKELKSINITLILMRMIGMAPVSNTKEERISDMMLCITTSTLVFATIVESNQLYFSRKDLTVITVYKPSYK